MLKAIFKKVPNKTSIEKNFIDTHQKDFRMMSMKIPISQL